MVFHKQKNTNSKTHTIKFNKYFMYVVSTVQDAMKKIATNYNLLVVQQISTYLNMLTFTLTVISIHIAY